MPPEATSLELAEKLLVLTYALGDAALRSENSELKALFSERAKILARLEQSPAEPAVLEILRQVQMAEASALSRFNESKAVTVQEIQKGLKGRKVAGAYAGKGTLRAYDTRG